MALALRRMAGLNSSPTCTCERINRAYIDLNDIQQLVTGIQQEHAQVLLLQCRHVKRHKCCSIFRAVDDDVFLGRLLRHPFSQFDGSLDLGCLGLADAVLIA